MKWRKEFLFVKFPRTGTKKGLKKHCLSVYKPILTPGLTPVMLEGRLDKCLNTKSLQETKTCPVMWSLIKKEKDEKNHPP